MQTHQDAHFLFLDQGGCIGRKIHFVSEGVVLDGFLPMYP